MHYRHPFLLEQKQKTPAVLILVLICVEHTFLEMLTRIQNTPCLRAQKLMDCFICKRDPNLGVFFKLFDLI